METGGAESKKIASDKPSAHGSKGKLVEADSKSLSRNEDHSENNLTKMYKLYSSLKGFAFNMPDGWDDKNISIFLGCCKDYIEDLVDLCGDDDNTIWGKIAQAGAEKSGSTTCFTVNSCMELAQCLKSYVIQNENRRDEAFRMLYDDIIDLLPYFPAPTESMHKNVRHRSRGKSTEKKETSTKSIPSVKSDSSVTSQIDTFRTNSPSLHEIDALIVSHCLQSLHLFGTPKTPIAYIWNNISQKIFEATRVKVDVKKKLEWVKRKIVKEVNKENGPKMRAKKFRILCHDYIKFFDYMPPRTIKKKDFLGADDLKDDPPLNNEPPNPTTKADSLTPDDNNTVVDVEYVHKKRRFSKTNTSAASDLSLAPSKSSENSSNLTKNDDQIKTGSVISSEEIHSAEVHQPHSVKSDGTGHENRVYDNEKKDTNNDADRPLTPASNKVQVSTDLSTPDNTDISVAPLVQTAKSGESKSISSSVLSDPNVTTTTWVKETSPDTSESDAALKSPQLSRSNYSNSSECLRLEEDPDAVFFETKYTLRGVTDNVKCYKPRKARRGRPPKGRGKPKPAEPFEKRILPQRSARRKTTSYKVSEEEATPSPSLSVQQDSSSSPKRSTSPELRGFPVQSPPSPVPALSPVSKLKRVYGRKPKIAQESDVPVFNKRKAPTEESVAPTPIKRTYQPTKKNLLSNTSYDMSYGQSRNINQYSDIQNQDSREDDSQYLEKVYGLRRKQTVDSEEEIVPSKRLPNVRLEEVFEPDTRPVMDSYRPRAQVDSPKFASGIHTAETHKKVGLGNIPNSKGNLNFSPANAYCPDSDSGSAEPYRPSSSSSGQLPQSSSIRPASLKSVQNQVDFLEGMGGSTLSIVEKYKSRVRDSPKPSNMIMQLMPSVASSNDANRSSALCRPSTSHGIDVISSPPEWFGNFVSEYKRHEMRKMSQLVRMQQELMDVENKKLAVLENILSILKKQN